MPATAKKLPPPPVELLEKLKWEQPPAKRPRGYFNNLRPITKLLLAVPMKLSQAADRLIQEGALPQQDRGHYMHAMRQWFSSLKAPKAAEVQNVLWRKNLYHGAIHAVTGDGKALCGVETSAPWIIWDGCGTDPVCNKCKGAARKQSLVIPEP